MRKILMGGLALLAVFSGVTVAAAAANPEPYRQVEDSGCSAMVSPAYTSHVVGKLGYDMYVECDRDWDRVRLRWASTTGTTFPGWDEAGVRWRGYNLRTEHHGNFIDCQPGQSSTHTVWFRLVVWDIGDDRLGSTVSNTSTAYCPAP